MIVTELYNGQGLGNQLWCYCVTRAIALRNNYRFGIQSPNKFKGYHLFKNIDFGYDVVGGTGPEGGPPISLPIGIDNYYKERQEINPVYGCDVSRLDNNLIHIKDNTKIDGVMQCEGYIVDHKDDILQWLELKKPIFDYSNNELCLIHIRGGDFFHQREVALDSNYYTTAIKYMLQLNSNMKFFILTDDVDVARNLLPGIQIISSSTNTTDPYKANHHLGGDISVDYSILNTAKNLILSNSSFAWWAAWTNSLASTVIAPKYWARHNISDGFWSNGDSLTRNWIYLGRDGNMYTYNLCMKEKLDYESRNKHLFVTK